MVAMVLWGAVLTVPDLPPPPCDGVWVYQARCLTGFLILVLSIMTARTHTHTHPSNNISLTHIESDTPSISLPTWASRGRSSYTHFLHPTQGGSRLLVHGGGGGSGGCWAVSCIWSPVLSSWQHCRCLVLWGCCPLALRAPSLASLLLLLGGAHSCHRDM